MNKFGDKLKEKRMQCKLTQSKLAEMLNVSDRTISKWETGNGYPDITMLHSIAMALNTTVSELLDSEDIKTTNITKPHPTDEKYRAHIKKPMVISISLLASTILLFILPILKERLPMDAIGVVNSDYRLYKIVSIILFGIVTTAYIVSISIFTYIIIQYRSYIKSKFNNFQERSLLKKYIYVYGGMFVVMVVMAIVALSINS